MIIRKAKMTDSSVISLLMNEAFGWEKRKPSSSLVFSNKNIICLVAENDHGELMGSASLHLLQKINGKIVAIVSEGDETVANIANHVIEIPNVSECLTPILATIPLQLLSYYIAIIRGCDVDQPRNLAKSVTVE